MADQTPVSTRLTPQGWIALGASFGFTSALVWQQPVPWAAFFGFGLMTCLLCGVVLIPKRLRRAQARWLLPRAIHAQEEVTIGVRLSAEGSCPPVTVMAWEPPIDGEAYVADLPGLSPTSTRVAWVTRFPHRGTITMPPLHLHSEQPFGMVAGQITVGQERDVTVYPAVGSVRRPIEDELLAWIADGLRSRDRGDEEIAHLRRYRPGDALHRIHWRASARHRGLLVSERQAPEARRLALLLDCCCSGRSHRLERSIAVAATLVDHLLARGWTISLHAPGLPREGMVGDRDQLMGGLAHLEATGIDDLDDRIPMHVPCLALLLQPRPMPADLLLRTWLPEQAQAVIAIPRGIR